jgi:hypothetical protein
MALAAVQELMEVVKQEKRLQVQAHIAYQLESKMFPVIFFQTDQLSSNMFD